MSDKTPLFPIYSRYGARVVEFAGWELPVQFAGIASEHIAVRSKAGLFDVSHMGEVSVRGKDSFNFLQHMLVNDCSHLEPGRAVYSPMCYQDGGCVDDLLVYMLGSQDYLLVVNASNTAKDFAWLLSNTDGYEVELENVSSSYAQLALQGPDAADILSGLTGPEALALKRYRFIQTNVAGFSCLVSRTGYTGEDGFELYMQPQNAIPLWEALLADGRAVPAGLGARDTLRMEAAMPLYGHELSPSISPLEAGLVRFVSLAKEEFIGRDALAGQSPKPPRELIGLELEGKGIPRAEYPVLAHGTPAGAVTSGTLSPWTGRAIAMALVSSEAAGAEDGFTIRIREHELPARRVPLPFYQRRRS